jgi:hypothetical protein
MTGLLPSRYLFAKLGISLLAAIAVFAALLALAEARRGPDPVPSASLR